MKYAASGDPWRAGDEFPFTDPLAAMHGNREAEVDGVKCKLSIGGTVRNWSCRRFGNLLTAVNVNGTELSPSHSEGWDALSLL